MPDPLYLKTKQGREAIIKETRDNTKLQEEREEGKSLSCVLMLPIHRP